MNPSELNYLEELYKEFIDTNGTLTYNLVDNIFHCFNNKIVIPVKAIEKTININLVDDIEIVKLDGTSIGFLCPISHPDNEHVIARLNESRLFSFFVDRLGLMQQIDLYSFSSSYVVIDSAHYYYYKRYMHTAEYWGGFTHDGINPIATRNVEKLIVNEGIKIPSLNHKESIVLAVHSASSFERFLKYYHQIELLFDSLFISRLKTINSTDLKDYSLIIKEFNKGSKTELDAFKYVLKNYLVDYNAIAKNMSLIVNHLQVADEMFNKLGKDTNPLKTEEDWIVLTELLALDSFDAVSCSNGRLANGTITKLIKSNNQDSFNELILNLCSYWIYRIRCCIAHNKVGEYLFSYNDEAFVSSFGEHLLIGIIRGIFSNSNLHSDLSL